MSLNFFKMKKLILFLIFLIHLLKPFFTNASNCNRVANLPEQMENLLPNYDKLNRLHISNLFFLETENPNKITINVREPSVFKILITPYLADIEVQVFLPSGEKETLEGYQDLPVSFLNFEITSGQITLNFKHKTSSEIKSNNKECNFPFFAMEMLLENKNDFKNRNSKVRKELEKLEDFSSYFIDVFRKIKNGKNLPMSIDHETLKLDLKELHYYRAFNTSILSSFDLDIEDQEKIINEKSKPEEANAKSLSRKYLINFNLFSDFLYGGSFYFAIMREEDIENGELNEFKCLFNNKCILSDRQVKNNINLQTVLTPGKYKILLMNFLDNDKYEILRKQIAEIPVSATLEIKDFVKDENRYNCPGRHLPQHLNFLTDKYLNDYLEFSGDIIMNTERLYDEINIYAEEDSLLRISAFAKQGENIDIEVYHIPKTGNRFENLLKSKGLEKGNGPLNPLMNILGKIFKKKEEEDGELKQLSEHFGESDGMLIPLLKDNNYRITFNYKDSMINENNLKSCETYFTKISLAKVKYLKALFPNAYSQTCNGANIATRRNDINKILKDFMDENKVDSRRKNSSKDKKNFIDEVYDSFANGYTTVSRVFFDRNNPYEILYNGKFSVENEVNFSIEVLSDFTTSFIVPVILPLDNDVDINQPEDDDKESLNFQNFLNQKHKKITFHENQIKLNLKKGKYRLFLINGISQYFNQNDVVENSRLTNFIDLDLLPKCMEFQVRVIAEKLLSDRTRTWECNSKHFEFIPSNLNNLLHLGLSGENIKQKFSYFSKDLLVPVKKHTMKIKTGKEGLLMRLSYEYLNKELESKSNDNIDEKKHGLIVNLLKSNKILKTAKSQIVEEDIKTSLKYITHFLRANTEYEITFEFMDKNNLFNYYNFCRLFKLEIDFIADSVINNNNQIENQCKENIPKIADIAYERIIGLTNSFFKYNSKSILQMFLSKRLHRVGNDNKEEQNSLDLETSHPVTSEIQFVYDPSNSKPFSHEYNFEVRSALSRVTITIENPYSSVVGISAKLFFINQQISEIIAIEDMDENGLYTIKGVQLEMGKYKVVFYSNNLADSKKDLSIYKKNFRKICVNFSASILIENRPFDFFSKHVSDNYMSCPYNSFPSNLNIPGYLSRESGYTMNLSGKFRINPKDSRVKFRIRETSLFKFHIKDSNNNIFSYVNIYKLKGNTKKKISEKLENEENFILLILEKGTYQIDYTFRGIDNSYLQEDKKCIYYECQLIINPRSNIKDQNESNPLIKANNNSNLNCNNALIGNIELNSFKTYMHMNFLNEKLKENRQVIAIPLTKKKGKFMMEIILNTYLDSNFGIRVMEKKDFDDEPKEFAFDSHFYENIVWIQFHYESRSMYFIEIYPESFENYNVCANLIVSYSIEDVQKDKEISKNSNMSFNSQDNKIHNEELKKSNCEISDHLPPYLFSEKNNKNHNSILEKYGGPQKANGQVDIFGEFLLPSDSSESRTTFYVSKRSILYVRIIPKYEKEANVYIEVYRDKNILYRYSHNDYMGVLHFHLDPNSKPYILQLTFDKNLNDFPCGSYEMIMTVVPRDIYKDEYLACDEENSKQKLPDELIADKPATNLIETYIKPEPGNNDFNVLQKDKNGNYFKNINLELKHSYAVLLMVEYVESDNYIDILLEENKVDSTRAHGNNIDSNDILEVGVLSHTMDPSTSSGIVAKRAISVNLKKGSYNIKLVYRKMFKNLLSRSFAKEMNQLCLKFNFEYEFSALNLKNDLEKNDRISNEGDKEEKDVDSEIDMNKISENEKINPDKNYILAVEPPGKKDIRLKKKFDVLIKFNNEIDKDEEYENTDFLDFIYLEDSSIYSKIYPKTVEEVKSNVLKFKFSSKFMQVNKCYVLKFSSDNPYYKKFESDGLEHKFCTQKCECNPMASFKCGKNGQCICHAPYSGPKCESCLEGFTPRNGECIEDITNCDEKKHCSNHGKCVRDENSQNYNSMICKCDPGFTSYGNEKNVYCNACSNPNLQWPYCNDINEENGGSGQALLEDKNTKCEDLPYLESKLYTDDDDKGEELNVQGIDGSLSLSEIYKVKNEEEFTEILIPEDAILRFFIETFEINDAKILVYKAKYDAQPLAYSEGKSKAESFVMRLDKRESPYFIKVIHYNMKSSCNKYKLKISIKPLNQMREHLKCNNPNIDISNKSQFFPSEYLTLESNGNSNELAKTALNEKEYEIPDQIIVNYDPNDLSKNKEFTKDMGNYDYRNTGVLSHSAVNEVFVYNVKLDVRNSFAISISLAYDFLSSDMGISLRDSNGKLLKAGKWMTQDDLNSDINDEEIIRTTLEIVLDPGVYYLAIKENVAANHLVQILKDETKNKKNSPLCFKFNMNMQYSLINKPDSGINTKKFESMFNRILSVEPHHLSNINKNKQFKVMINFEDSVLPTLKDKNKKLKDVFWFENSQRQRIEASAVYLQGALKKSFLLVFEKDTLKKNECYELNYNLDLLISEDKEKKLLPDKPISHKYCTKSCDCNPHTDFKCTENNECQCELPYTGKGCYNCMEGYVMVNFKCITQENCDKHFCNLHGKCLPVDLPYFEQGVVEEFLYPKCRCDAAFRGDNDCSSCTNPKLTFPDCELLKIKPDDDKDFDKKDHQDEMHKIKTEKKELEELKKEDEKEIEETNETEEIEHRCNFPFVPFDLDTLGYLHLEGNLHLARKYSFKHFANSHYKTSFTLKHRSHVKIYLEHSKSSHLVSLFLMNEKDEYIESGQLFIGPAGIGSSSYIDVFLDPLQENGKPASYKIAYFIKDIDKDDEVDPDKNIEDKEIKDECFNAFVEIAIFPAAEESNSIQIKNSRLPQRDNLPEVYKDGHSLFDYHLLFAEEVKKDLEKYNYIRDENRYNMSDVIYFYHDYFYVPDHLDSELILEILINSNFLNSQVGVLLEIVEIPQKLKFDHKKITANNLKNMFADVKIPLCEIHCFTGVKKENEVILSRMLPSDTYFRIWLYDIMPKPNLANYNELNKNVEFEMSFNLKNVKSHDKKIVDKHENSICSNEPLPSNLNVKGYLGDSKYIEKWGFHLLDSFRIDNTLFSGLIHTTYFELTQFSLFRLVTFHGRIETDIELYFERNNDYILLVRSNTKNFEEVIVAEIPPGKYKILFKFFPPANGYHKCESIRLEFSINNFNLIQENVNRMIAKYKNKPNIMKVDLFDMLKNEKDIFTRDFAMNRYIIPIQKPFFIDNEDLTKFQPTEIISEISFTIKPEDNKKIELYAIVQSDFLLLDASWYLTETSTKITESSLHKKNMNVLTTSGLQAGNYILTLRYYRKIHTNNYNKDIKDREIYKLNWAEIDVNLSFINRDSDKVHIVTSEGPIEIAAKGSKYVSHNWLCRHKGTPTPKSLESLRYFDFNTDMHILDNYLIPAIGESQQIIKFKLRYAEKMMLRVYVECHYVDIDIQLRELVKNNEYKVLAESKQDVFFETVMALIKDDTEYEIVLFFKESATSNSDDALKNSNFNNCNTFKMEIALENNHNYACPESNKYAELTSLNTLPKILPPKLGEYKYDSRKLFLGEDKGSGYVYMIRKDQDQEIKYNEFLVASEIDFKFEVIFDFLQSPLNIYLVQEKYEEDSNKSEKDILKNQYNRNRNIDRFGHVLKNSKIKNADIIDFGEIYENRSSMLVKNLPPGKYSIYLYLPALKTTFVNESRVCSIYDIVIEVKKSKGHFKEKELTSLSEIKDDNLDIPTYLPKNLNSLKFIGTNKYINNVDHYYLRRNKTNTANDREITNTIQFEIDEESLVEFYVNIEKYQKHPIQIKIDGVTKLDTSVIKILNRGKYSLFIELNKVDPLEFEYNSLENILQFYVGITPIARVKDIYSYNNMLSSYHQCQSSELPVLLVYDSKSKSYHHIDKMFKFNVNNLQTDSDGIATVGKMNIALNSRRNRILIELGSDLLYGNLSVEFKSEGKSWDTKLYKNVAFLDLVVPKGKYSIEIKLNSPITVKEYDCILLSFKIHAFDLDKIKDHSNHFRNHIFDSSKLKKENELFTPRIYGEVLPIRISGFSDNENSKISYSGEYNIHLKSALYFDAHQTSRDNDNLNEIMLNMKYDSLVRVSIYNLRPKNFVVVPLLKQRGQSEEVKAKEKLDEKKNIIVKENLEFVSHNKKERNSVWFVEKNSILDDNNNYNNRHKKNDDYLIQLEKEVSESFNEKTSGNILPIYGLDISINSLDNLSQKFECPSEDGKTLKYILPNSDIPKDKFVQGSYHEIIDFSYITESQYSDVISKNKNENEEFEYMINLDIEEDSHLNLEIGYDNSISLFDAFIVKYDDKDVTQSSIIATSDVFFNKASKLFFKRIIETSLSKGKYSIVIVEKMWADISRDIRAFSGIDNHLCLPFEYKLDIVNVGQKNAKPEILSVFPPGSLLFKAIEEDINVRISLTKTPFTQKHKQITDNENFIDIVEAFYFVEVERNSQAQGQNDNINNPTNSITNLDISEKDKLPKRIKPDKVFGASDGKNWDLLFLHFNFESNKSYKLMFDDRFLFDMDYHKFSSRVILPTFRVETKKEEIFQMADKIKEIKEEKKAQNKLEKEENEKKPPAPETHKKCSNNGKLIYDNILKRYHCSCIHGFSGKYCSHCEGVVNPKTKICEIDDDENEEKKENESDRKIEEWRNKHIPEEVKAEEYHNNNNRDSNNNEKGNSNVLSCGNCVHGYCDTTIGKCICEIGYTGKFCDSKKSETSRISGNKDNKTSEDGWLSYFYSFFDYIIKGV